MDRETRRSSLEAEDLWTTKLRHDWAIYLEQLPNEVIDVTLNISTFKIRLKTFLFKQSFPDE